MESVHPIFVHFPIALVLTALGLDTVALVSKRPALHRVALWNLSLGTLGAAAAVFTGLKAAEVAKHSFEIWQIMELHEHLGISTLILGLMACGLRFFKRDQLSPRLRVFSLILMAAFAGTWLDMAAR